MKKTLNHVARSTLESANHYDKKMYFDLVLDKHAHVIERQVHETQKNHNAGAGGVLGNSSRKLLHCVDESMNTLDVGMGKAPFVANQIEVVI